jgi:superfamily II DNA or RNA helicase
MTWRPDQETAVQKALSAPGRRWIFGDEQGLGKTWESITACSRLYPGDDGRILIVSPALVREHWSDEIARRWPARKDAVGVVRFGDRKTLSKKQRAHLEASYSKPIRVLSYNMLPRPETCRSILPGMYCDIIIFDECHLLQHPDSSWSKAASALVQGHPYAAVFGCTGTPMPNYPMDFWNVGDILCPGRFGERYTVVDMDDDGNPTTKAFYNRGFGLRYTNASHNGYGWEFKGINDEHVDEFRARVSSIMSRTTRAEVAHLLPPFTVRRLSGVNLEKSVIEWTADALRQSSHVVILTHLRKTARDLAALLQGKPPFPVVSCLTGEEDATNRYKSLKTCANSPTSVIVATMHSVGRGVDLGWNQQALFAELYWRPETLSQALGRFGRMNNKTGTIIDLLAVEGTVSERIASRLRDKLVAIGQTQKLGVTDNALVSSFSADEGTVLAALQDLSDIDGDKWLLDVADEMEE